MLPVSLSEANINFCVSLGSLESETMEMAWLMLIEFVPSLSKNASCLLKNLHNHMCVQLFLLSKFEYNLLLSKKVHACLFLAHSLILYAWFI